MDATVPPALREKYEKAGQLQVFRYMDAGKLSPNESAALIKQLEELDLDRIAKLHADAMAFDQKGQDDLGELEPLESYDSIADASTEQKQSWEDAGLAAIKAGEVAALVLAGGAGTRLGFDKPKGMYDVGLPSGKTLFQIFIERLRRLSYLANGTDTGLYIPFYVMTSVGENHNETVKFFQDNEYFGYGKDNIMFFPQGTLPCMTEDGKIMLETGFKVGVAADGNGGIYGALQSTGQIRDMRQRGVKYVHVFSVDNLIGKVADPYFVGYCIQKNADVGNKVVWKVEPGEKVGVVGKRGGQYTVIEYSEMKEADTAKRDSQDKLIYGAGNICNHFYSVDFLEGVTDNDLIFHVARKKIPEPSEDGKTAVTPNANTGIKLECFIFDCFSKSQRMAVLEGPRDEEFSPVKNAPGQPKDSPDTARAMLTAQSKKWLDASGVGLIDGDGQLEIGPHVSYRGENLNAGIIAAVCGDTQIDLSKGDVYIDVKAPGSTSRIV